jgi:glyoxylase-like metal-dependent hydrolase (beta-lactamase superfamily II)
MSVSLGVDRWPFRKGLHDLGNSCYAYLQPNGSWGYSNAGLVADSGESLLIDTLFDVPLTRDMLAAMRAAEPAAARIDTVVNTHSNGDHCNGNELVADAEIIASAAAAAEMAEETPETMVKFKEAAPALGDLGEFFLQCFGPFQFEGINKTLPNTTFEGELTRMVGNKRVELIGVGPAHTRGDVLVYVPDDRTVFTGDILFIDGHPILWAGPVRNWIDACARIEAMDVETVVPGHGPITDKRGAAAVREYLSYVEREARTRYDAGMDAIEAARDIALHDYDSWIDAERIVVNVSTLYREFFGDSSPPEIAELFTQMAALAKDRPQPRAAGPQQQ